MILFKNLRWKNFLSTGNYFNEIKLDEVGTTLIVGENGAGKSTFMEALVFALYNKPFRNINKPALVNSINQKHCIIEVEFDIGRNSYKIVRGIKPAIFEIWVNDKLLNQDAAARDYQDVLEKHILRLNYKSFCQIVVLGTANFTPFMQLPAAARREIIEDLLDLKIFTIMNKLMKDDSDEAQIAMSGVDYNIRLTEQRIALQRNHVSDLKAQTIKQIEKKTVDIEENKQRILNEVKFEQTLMEQIAVLQKSVVHETKHKTTNKKLNNLRHALMAKIGAVKQEIKTLEETTICPTCKQNFEGEHKAHEIQCRSTVLTETQDGLEKLQIRIVEAEEKLKAIEDTNADIVKLYDRARIHTANIRALEAHNKTLEKEIVELQTEHKKIDVGSITESKNQLKTHKSQKENLSNDMEMFRVASLILKDNGIKAKIIKQYVPIINKLINKYLAAMDFYIAFELNETFAETIKSRHRDDFTYASFSEGEKARIDLALLFAWRSLAKIRNSAATNLIIMDETFDSSLDSQGNDDLMKIINEISNNANIFVISHKIDAYSDKFEKVIKFEKVKNFSKVVA